jgi:hypothetical protein
MKILKDYLSTDPVILNVLSQSRSLEERKMLESMIINTIGPVWESLFGVIDTIKNDPKKVEQLNEEMNNEIVQKK